MFLRQTEHLGFTVGDLAVATDPLVQLRFRVAGRRS
jgi:hypothetical protein